MSEVHRYKAVKMLSEVGNAISYSPHGPEVVLASEHDAQLAALREELATAQLNLSINQAKLGQVRACRAAAEQRNAELQKAHDEQQLLALVRLSDLRDNNGEFEKLYDLLRNCYPFVRARCDATDFGDASARTTLEMIDAAFKRIELKPTESGASE